jgi:RNA polymerase sigma factor (sigma-70 family)
MARHDDTPLQDIVTRWSVIFDAQRTQGDAAENARDQLIVRYHRAVYRYVLRLLGDEHAAAELVSDFALRLKEVAPFIKRADPAKGRFRHYLQAVLWRMVQDYHRQRQRGKARLKRLAEKHDEADYPEATPADEQDFQQFWGRDIVDQVWATLGAMERDQGKPYATLFRLLPGDDQPQPRSEELARKLSEATGKKYSRDATRQLLHRGRELFSALLIEEIRRTLEAKGSRPSAEDVEEELIALGLLNSYCKKALATWPA